MTTLYRRAATTADGQTVEVQALENGPHTSVMVRFAGIGNGWSVRMTRTEALALATDLLTAYQTVKAHNNQQQKVGTET